MTSWVDYWNTDHPIYVNERHKLLHAQGIASDFRRHVQDLHCPPGTAVVLDYGCGEALYAEEVGRLCGRLLLCDAAPAVRRALETRVSANPAIDVLSPEEVTALEPSSLDLVVANSLVQYLTEAEVRALLSHAFVTLKPGGRIIIADVIPTEQTAAADAVELLRFALYGGFLVAAVRGLLKTALSDYRKLRQQLGIAKYDEATMLALLEAQGFDAERAAQNFGHNQSRMTFSGVKPALAEQQDD
jgi:SAM-dependent methyltransferase